jgi:hypothetical protein
MDGGETMKPGVAALRLGFLARQLWFKQLSVWAKHIPDKEDVRPCISQIDACVLALSNLVNDYQRATLAEILERIADRQLGAAECLGEILNEELKKDHDTKKALARLAKRTLSDKIIAPWRKWQREDWKALRTLLNTLFRADPRLAAWFEVGDHFADILNQLRLLELVAPLSDESKAYLCSGIDRLSDYEQRRVRPLLQFDNADHLLLGEEMCQTFTRLCALLMAHEEDLVSKPKWNGSVLEFHNERMPIKLQANNVITVILDQFESKEWVGTVTLPPKIEGDITQALFYFNKKCPFMRLTRTREKVSWSDQIRPRSE